MVTRKRWACWLPVLAVSFLLVISQSCSTGKLEPYLEIELKRLEETYNLLDEYAQEIWPGWDNYNDVEFQVQFPNMVFLIVNPRDEIPEGYEKLADRTVRGKEIYLNRTEELPIKLEPPLHGGGGGGMTIRIRLRENEQKTDKEKLNEKEMAQAQSESQILLYVHEFFHGFQSQVWPKMKHKQRPRKTDIKKTEKQEKKKIEKKKQRRIRRDYRPPRFEVNAEYATYKEIGGLALSKAYKENI